MATTRAIIDVSINTGDATAQLRNLQTQINAFNATLNKNTIAHAQASRQFADALTNIVNVSQAFTAEQVKMETSARRLDQTLVKGKGSLGQYFSARFNKDGAEAAAVMSLANARAQALQTQFVKLSAASNGFRDAIAIRPLQALNDSLEVANQKAAIHSAMFRQATTSMINFGKNTQWAGRQLMVGFTVPLTIFGVAAGKTFKEVEQAAVRFKKVYGDAFTTPAEIEKNMKAVEGLALEFTKYGIAVKDTIGLAAEAAAAGAQNADLIAATTEATRLATLGQMEQSEALTATISLQNAFKLSSKELATEVNFLNMVENQTVVTLQDLAEAIPRVAPVIVGLGGDVRDMAAMLAAMQEGGVSAAQGANALKSGLGSLINPTNKASESLAKMGININAIVGANRGDLMGTVNAFAQALSGLDKFTRQQALEELFGKYQYARLGALFDNIIKDGTQASRVLQIAGISAEQMAKSAERELSVISEATSTKYMAAMERFKLAIAPIGELFMKISTPIINFFSKLFEMFDKLPDGAKSFAAFAAIIVGVVVPAGTMFLGLLMNLLGTLAKFGHIIGVAVKAFGKGGFGGAIQAVSQSLRYMSLEEIDAANAANQLGRSTNIANSALLEQVTAAGNARLAIDRLTESYARLITRQMEVATGRGPVFAAGAAASAAAASGAAGRANVRPRPQTRNSGGIIYMSSGGTTVPGSGNTDTVPAMLTPGEFVVNKNATRQNLALLHAINDGGKVNGYNKGGKIPGVKYLSTAGPVGFGSYTLSELEASFANAALGLGGASARQSTNLAMGVPTSARTINQLTPSELSQFNNMMDQALSGRGINEALIRLFGLGVVPTTKDINDALRLGRLSGPDAAAIFGNPDIWLPMTRTEAGSLLPTSGSDFSRIIASNLRSRLSGRGLISDDDIYDLVESTMRANGGADFYDELQREPGAVRFGLSQLVSQQLKKTNPRGSIDTYSPILSSVASGVRQVDVDGRSGVLGNFGELGWLLLAPGKTKSVSGRMRSYENEPAFSSFGPGMVKAHAFRSIRANSGGLIPGVQYANVGLLMQNIKRVSGQIGPKTASGKRFPKWFYDTTTGSNRSRQRQALELSSELGLTTYTPEQIQLMKEQEIKTIWQGIQRGHVAPPISKLQFPSSPQGITPEDFLPGIMMPMSGAGRGGNLSMISGGDPKQIHQMFKKLEDKGIHPMSIIFGAARELGYSPDPRIFNNAYEEMMTGLRTRTTRFGTDETFEQWGYEILRRHLGKIENDSGNLFQRMISMGTVRGTDPRRTRTKEGEYRPGRGSLYAAELNKGGKVPGIQYFATAGMVRRLMQSGRLQPEKLRSYLDANGHPYEKQTPEVQQLIDQFSGRAAGTFSTSFGGNRTRHSSQSSQPTKTEFMTDLDFGDATGLLRLFRSGEFDQYDEPFLIDYIKEGLEYGRLKDFHAKAKIQHGNDYESTMAELVAEAQKIGNPKLIDALVRLTGIQAKNSGGFIQRLIGGGPAIGATMRRVVSSMSARKAAAQKLQTQGFNSLSDQEKQILRASAENVGSMSLFKRSSLISPDIDPTVARAILGGREGDLIGKTINTPVGSYSEQERIARTDRFDTPGMKRLEQLRDELFKSRYAIKENGKFRKPVTGKEALIARQQEVGKLPLHLVKPGMTEEERIDAWFKWKGQSREFFDLDTPRLKALAEEYDDLIARGAGKVIVYRLRPSSSSDLAPGQSRIVSTQQAGGITTITLETGKVSATPVTKIGGAPIMPGGTDKLHNESEWFVNGFNNGGVIPGIQYLMSGRTVQPTTQKQKPRLSETSPLEEGPFTFLTGTATMRVREGDLSAISEAIEKGFLNRAHGSDPRILSDAIKSELLTSIGGTPEQMRNENAKRGKLFMFREKIKDQMLMGSYSASRIKKVIKDVLNTGDEELIDYFRAIYPEYMEAYTSGEEGRVLAALIGLDDIKDNLYNKGGMIPLQYFQNGGDVAALQAFASGNVFESARKNYVPGVGNKDTVPAALTPGEFVINKQATAANLPLLKAINSGAMVRANKGGLLGIQYLQQGAITLGPQNQMLNLGQVGPTSPLPVNISEVDGQDPKRTNMGARSMGRGFAVSTGLGTLGGAMMMAPMIPAVGQNQQLSGGLATAGTIVSALSMLAMLPPQVALVAAGFVALGGTIAAIVIGGNELKNSLSNMNKAMNGSTESVKAMGQAFGRQTALQQISLTRAQAAGGGITQESYQAAGEFVQSAAGTKLLEDLKLVQKMGKDQNEALINQLSRSILAGAITPEEARSVAIQIGTALGNEKIGVQVSAQITEMFGENGERIEKNRMSLAADLLPEIDKKVLMQDAEQAIKQMGKVDWSKGFDLGAAGMTMLTLGGNVVSEAQIMQSAIQAISDAAYESAMIEKEQRAAVTLEYQQGIITLEQYKQKVDEINKLDISGQASRRGLSAYSQVTGISEKDLLAYGGQTGPLQNFGGVVLDSVVGSVANSSLGLLGGFGLEKLGITPSFQGVGISESDLAAQTLAQQMTENTTKMLEESGMTEIEQTMLKTIADTLGGAGTIQGAEIFQGLAMGDFSPQVIEALVELNKGDGLKNLIPPDIQDKAKYLKELGNQLSTFVAYPDLQTKMIELLVKDPKGGQETLDKYEEIFMSAESLPDDIKKTFSIDVSTETGINRAGNILPGIERLEPFIENLQGEERQLALNMAVSENGKAIKPGQFVKNLDSIRKTLDNLGSEKKDVKRKAMVEYLQMITDENGNRMTPEMAEQNIADLEKRFGGKIYDLPPNILKQIFDFQTEINGAEKMLSALRVEKAMIARNGGDTSGIDDQITDLQILIGQKKGSQEGLVKTTETEKKKGGGGGGQKSLSQQLSDQLKEIRKLYAALGNAINPKTMKAFIAGPFAPEFLQYLADQGEEGRKILEGGRKKIAAEYEKFKEIKFTELAAASRMAPGMRREQLARQAGQTRFTTGLVGRGLSQEQVDFVNEQVGEDIITARDKLLKKKKEGTITDSERNELRDYINNINNAIASSEKFASISLADKINTLNLEFTETNADLNKTLELMASGIPPEFASELASVDGASEMLAPQLSDLAARMMEVKVKTELAKGALTNLSEEFDLMGQIASTQIEKINKLEIAPLEKEIDGFNKSISNLEKSKKPEQTAIDNLRKQEEQIQKVYDQRVKSLDEVQRLNDKIAAQQKGQMDIASALSRGDIAGAAQAAMQLQQTMAQQRVEDTKNALQQQNDADKEAIAARISVHENNIKNIDNDIVALQDRIASKQAEIEKSKEKQVALEEKIYSLQLLRDAIETKKAAEQSVDATERELLTQKLQSQLSLLTGLGGLTNIPGAAGALALLNQPLVGVQQLTASASMTASAPITNDLKTIKDTMPIISEAVKELIDKESGLPKNFEDVRGAVTSFAEALGVAAKALQNFVKVAETYLQRVKTNAIGEINVAAAAAIASIAAAPKTKSMYGGFIMRAFGGMINYKGSREPAPGMMFGGKMRKYATGAFVPGSGMTDKVPALLTPGEFVVRKPVADQYGGLLQSLNSQIYPKMMAFGGPVSTSMSQIPITIPSQPTYIISSQPEVTNVSPISTNNSQFYQVNPTGYNYNINVNAQTNASPDDIANAVMYKIKMTNSRRVRGGRVSA